MYEQSIFMPIVMFNKQSQVVIKSHSRTYKTGKYTGRDNHAWLYQTWYIPGIQSLSKHSEQATVR